MAFFDVELRLLGTKEKVGIELVVERAYFFEPKPSSAFWVLGPDKPEPVKIALESGLSPSFILIKSNFPARA